MTSKIVANSVIARSTHTGSHVDPETLRVEEAKTFVIGVLADPAYDNVAYKLADVWGINSGHFTQLLRNGKLSPTLDNLLVSKGHIDKRLPIDPRPRVWMRTDNVQLAAEQLTKHYCTEEIAHGLAVALEQDQVQDLLKTLGNDGSQKAR